MDKLYSSPWRMVISCAVISVSLASPHQAVAATITNGNVTTTLGPTFFVDDAATGGGDSTVNEPTVKGYSRNFSGLLSSGQGSTDITITGFGFASSASTTANDADGLTVSFTYLGADEAVGGGDDVFIGSASAGYNHIGAGEYVFGFDSPLMTNLNITGVRFQIEVAPTNSTGDGSVRFKNGALAYETFSGDKLSVAGTATSTNVAATATQSGAWDAILWSTNGGTVSGGLNDGDTALIGSNYEVTYGGVPANEVIATLNLGQNTGNAGHGTLVITSGTFGVTGNITGGRNNAVNEGFLKVLGGSLQVGGDVNLGRTVEGADGLLEVGNGGSVNITGDLNLGAFLDGGALLRFHNPGSSPAVQVGGTLLLGRASLGLTFDTNYTHVPGTQIPLVEYASRDSQFLNYRRGEEFNAGPNRFCINYGVEVGGGRKQITLTALTNWPATSGPNIVFLFADDQGYADVSMQGYTRSSLYPTPRIDSIATSGARLTDAYVAGSVCHPSRCALMTGRYQHRFAVEANLGGPSYNGMGPSQRTVPRRLQGLGYRTYAMGKWHLGETIEFHPNVRGFDRFYGITSGSRTYYGDPSAGENKEFQEDMTPRPQDEGPYVTDRIGDACVDFIDEHLTNHPGQPFYMYASFTAPHTPMHADPPRYTTLSNTFGLGPGDYTSSGAYTLANMTVALDENVGKILDKLAAEGLSSNTLVLYYNDNGGPEGDNFSQNNPLKSGKGTLWEGGVRVPCAVQWPGVIPAGQTIATPVNLLDFMATFVNAGNAPNAARNGLDGIDLLPLLRDGTPLPAERVLTWRRGGPNFNLSTLRKGDWKLVITDSTQVPSLYNLASDISETSDVAGGNPGIVEHLMERYLAWDSQLLAPFYNLGDLTFEAGLERYAGQPGFRILNRGSTPKYLSTSLREPFFTSTNFAFGFYMKPAETNHVAGAQLWFALGVNQTSASFIRAGVDFGSGLLRLEEGGAGAAQVSLPALPTNWEAGVVTYDTSTSTLSYSLGGTNVSLVLSGSYPSLGFYGCGASAMAGDVTPPYRLPVPSEEAVSSNILLTTTEFAFHSQFLGDSVFAAPVLDRAVGSAVAFTPDPDPLVENLGGGLYRITTNKDSGQTAEYFQVGFNQP